MAERMVIEANWGYQDFVLTTGVLAERGKLACIDKATGLITKGAATGTLIPIGVFMTTLTGDGVKAISVQLFYPIAARWWDNDTAGAFAAADVGDLAYVKDDQTVAKSGAVSLGLVLAVDSRKGVLVYSSYPFAPDAIAAAEDPEAP